MADRDIERIVVGVEGSDQPEVVDAATARVAVPPYERFLFGLTSRLEVSTRAGDRDARGTPGPAPRRGP